MFNWARGFRRWEPRSDQRGDGAYAVMFPKHQILTFFFIFLIPVPAIFDFGVLVCAAVRGGDQRAGNGDGGRSGLVGAHWGVLDGSSDRLGGEETIRQRKSGFHTEDAEKDHRDYREDRHSSVT